MAKDLSQNMQRLAEAIRTHPNPVRTALCGFDLWIEVLSSEHVGPREFLKGGGFAKGDEDEKVCPYCSTLYRYDPSLGARRSEPAGCLWEPLAA